MLRSCLHLTLVAGSSYRGIVLLFPEEMRCHMEAVQWTVRIRTAFAAIGGAAALLESSSSGEAPVTYRYSHYVTRAAASPSQLDMYGSDVSWLALNSSYDKAFGTRHISSN